MSQTNQKLFETYKGDWNKLLENEQEIIRIWRLDADMYNGGFIQFFCNWGYDNYMRTCEILNKIGASNSLKIITECEKIISPIQNDKRLENYWDIPKYMDEYITEEEDIRLHELDELYWENENDILLLGYNYYCKK